MLSPIELNNGVTIPRLGLGVYQAQPGEETKQAVLWALELGYRHIDTAALYANENDVGEAVRESGVPRGDVFITTKVWNDDQGYETTLSACERSLERLGLEKIDLYVVHWPEPGRRLETWRALEKLYADGRIRAAGVSNFMIRHLEELRKHSRLVPAVNQIEMSPFLYQPDLLEYCRDRGIHVEAYSPLTRGQRLGHPMISQIASRRNMTPAQVLIRWALQHDAIVLPKSVHRERIKENWKALELSLDESDMKALDALNENAHFCWDPTNVP